MARTENRTEGRQRSKNEAAFLPIVHSLFLLAKAAVKALDLANLDSRECLGGNASMHAERLKELPSTPCDCAKWSRDNRASVTRECLLASPLLPRAQR